MTTLQQAAPQILILNAAPVMGTLIAEVLEKAGLVFRYQVVSTAAEIALALDRQSWVLIISDHHISQFPGLDALRLV